MEEKAEVRVHINTVRNSGLISLDIACAGSASLRDWDRDSRVTPPLRTGRRKDFKGEYVTSHCIYSRAFDEKMEQLAAQNSLWTGIYTSRVFVVEL